MPKFSLIVPVYDVEKYLPECLDSCINQTFKDIEIICVNDCSPDGSGKILDEYAKSDPRIRIINHETNKGLGAARNSGISVATGIYSWFVDSDDYILSEACEILDDVTAQIKADVIRFNRIEFQYNIYTSEKKILPQESFSWISNKIYERNDYKKLEMPDVSAWMFIAATSLLKKNKFREGVVHEDNDFTPILFSEAKSIYLLDIPLYCARRREGSITNGGIGGLTKQRTIDCILALDSLYEYIAVNRLPKSHFCTRTAVGLCSYINHEYRKFPGIHTKERDETFRNVEKLGPVFNGNFKLYNDIIANYGNTRLLEFILRAYRFIVKKFFAGAGGV